MDKVKLVVAQLKKQYFWVLCLLIVVTVLVVWSMANADVDDRTRARVSELDRKTDAVVAVKETTNPPNEGVIAAIQASIVGTASGEGLKQKVVSAWQFLYEKQTEKNPLPKVLDATFVKDFQQLQMGQIKELPESDLEQYQNKIHSYVSPGEAPKEKVKQESLFDRVNLRRAKNTAHEEAAAKGGDARHRRGRGRLPQPGDSQSAEAEPVEMVGVLEWDENDLNRIIGQFQWDVTPDTETVQLAQEDLWVYEALLRTIENTNKGTTYENAAIKRVDALEIGKLAARSWGQAEEPVIVGLRAAAGKARGGAGGPPGQGLPGRGMRGPRGHDLRGGGMARGGAEPESALAGRYVDDAGNPLFEGAKHPAEFKMMPINLRLLIHQKKVTELLAECGNSNMPIVVCGVRFRPGEGDVISAAGPAAAGGAASPTPGAGGMTPPAAVHLSSHSAAGTGPEGSAAEPLGSPYLPIEVRGIIYIYNPPDLKKLGTGGSGGPAAAAGSPQAAPPPGGAGTAAPARQGGRP
jgi:hypothetical protein